MVSAFSFGIRQNEQKKEADKAAEVEKAEFFCEINTKKSEKILELGWKRKNIKKSSVKCEKYHWFLRSLFFTISILLFCVYSTTF